MLSVIIPTDGVEQPAVATLAALVPGAAAGIIREVLLVDRSGNGVIERVAYPMLDGAAALPAAAMLDRVSQVSLRYRLAGAWSSSWQGQPRTPLPDAVEMTITRTDGVVFRELFLVGSGYGVPDIDTGGGQ